MSLFPYTDPSALARRPVTPERIALEELVAAVEGYLAPTPMDRIGITKSRLTLALNAARNALKAG